MYAAKLNILGKYGVMSQFARFVGGWAECRIKENTERAALALPNLNRSFHLEPGGAALVLADRMSIARLDRVISQLCGRCQGKHPFPWWTLPMRRKWGGVGPDQPEEHCSTLRDPFSCLLPFVIFSPF